MKEKERKKLGERKKERKEWGKVRKKKREEEIGNELGKRG